MVFFITRGVRVTLPGLPISVGYGDRPPNDVATVGLSHQDGGIGDKENQKHPHIGRSMSTNWASASAKPLKTSLAHARLAPKLISQRLSSHCRRLILLMPTFSIGRYRCRITDLCNRTRGKGKLLSTRSTLMRAGVGGVIMIRNGPNHSNARFKECALVQPRFSQKIGLRKTGRIKISPPLPPGRGESPSN